MLLERHSKLERIIALLLLRVIASLLELFTAISSFLFPHTFTANGSRFFVLYVLKSCLLLSRISNTWVGKTINGFLRWMVWFSIVKLVQGALSWAVRKSLSITGAWESWEQSGHYWERLKKEKAESINKVPCRQAVARNGPILASLSQGKAEVIPSGLSISDKIG